MLRTQSVTVQYQRMTTDWTAIESFPTEIHAMIAKGQLEDAGIDVRSQLHQRGDALLGGMGMLTGPHTLLVREKDLAKAKKILASQEA